VRGVLLSLLDSCCQVFDTATTRILHNWCTKRAGDIHVDDCSSVHAGILYSFRFTYSKSIDSLARPFIHTSAHAGGGRVINQ
jgi:hypothetical protein